MSPSVPPTSSRTVIAPIADDQRDARAPDAAGEHVAGRCRRRRANEPSNGPLPDDVGVDRRSGPRSAGSARGSRPSTMNTSHAIESQRAEAEPLLRRRVGSAGAAAIGIRVLDLGGDVSVSGSTVLMALPECSRVPDPRIEHGVEDVDEEVHEHVADRDDATRLCTATYCRAPIASKISCPCPGSPKIPSMTTAPPMSVPTLRPATVSSVRLDGRSACRHRMRRVADALALRHGDEVLLQRRDHVAAQQAHVDRDLARPRG